MPRLAGQDEAVLLIKLQNFRTGKSPLHSLITGLSERDLADLAAFYASRKRSASGARASRTTQPGSP
ncbi:MAG: hypothetical protein NZ524_00830 [Thiobacillaceae bacterium]|nr:hypothetical protein [Thiobacillaceae bacterium]MCX7672450.1 hypothetical protein [Thiobacillaceae bacterium]MDW8323118.1 hypothetical protein [Burkholderiales bacterium]